jgi:porphobilinogen deaminase
MGGGCQTPVGAYATIVGKEIDLRAVSFLQTQVRRARARAPISDAAGLGGRLASQLK